MLWLVWRQHRWQLLAVAALTAAYCGYLLWLVRAAPEAVRLCGPLDPECTELNQLIPRWTNAVFIGNLLPVAVGVFWGAPLLAHEVEQGTIRLAFTQSVSRRRWLAAKLGVLGGVAVLLGLAVGATVSWSTPRLDAFSSPPFGNDLLFSQAGLMPAATWVFALLAGVAFGAFVRRLMPAVAATVVALSLAFAGLIALRPHLIPPVDRIAVTQQEFVGDPGPEAIESGWIYRVSYLDKDGHELSSAAAGRVCADPSNSAPTTECVDRIGLRQRVVYQPANRYVWFQLAEGGLLLVVSAGLAWAVRRRVAEVV
ncbi:ABC-2 family transporter [Asanoa ferruginea]|uniref:ABC-2 family transporter n=1 Tax=Asanoa ferruginea TaxID=53367 RepID=A0A3D9ZSF6_9ACTN|nr:ABC transporter permease subunit [Asanoa ferruginea]REG00172.1 ABC-2 family transporter [Asanoa ferruginea]GIF46129.1 transporter [Asanoa ferruginea]